jgi:colicin import membrane protein
VTRRTSAAVLSAGLAGVLLTGCAADPKAELRASVESITADANDRDARGVRDGVADLLRRIDDAERAGDLTAAEAATMRDRAAAVQAAADSIDEDLIARREAEEAAAEAQRQLEAEREAARQAEEQRQAEERRRAEEEAARQAEEQEDAEEEAEKAAEEAEKAAEEAEKKRKKDEDDD